MKIKTAYGLDFEKCDCGCGHTFVYLLDAKGRPFARFSVADDQWEEFGADVARVQRDEEPVGPKPAMPAFPQ